MSLFGTMKTAVSGMNAQANRLGTVGDNIANSSTTGYKKAYTSFSSMVLPSTGGSYNSGGVESNIRYSISEQGALTYTTSTTDLAIQGEGFFVVSDATDSTYLTRAGSFQVDEDGYLVNSAGYTLLGYSYDSGTPAAVVNGFDGLEAINVGQSQLTATASTTGEFGANLDSGEDIVTGDTPALNSATSEYTHKSSLVAYDSLGNEVLYDFYYTKINDNEWEVSVFRNDEATSGTSFPYSPTGLLASTTLTFDPTTGALDSSSADAISFTDSSGTVPLSLDIDLSEMTQLSYDFTVATADVDGNAPSSIESVEISKDGTVSAVYADGTTDPLYRIAMATVQSPDNLTVVSGNVYSAGSDSGVITTGFADSGTFGTIVSGALESSNVDLASELTEMIEAQRSYTANSKVFQTGSDLMDVLINLKR